MNKKYLIIEELTSMVSAYVTEAFPKGKFPNQLESFPAAVIETGTEERLYEGAGIEVSLLEIFITIFVFEDTDPLATLYAVMDNIEDNVIRDYCRNTTVGGIRDFQLVRNDDDSGIMPPMSHGVMELVVQYER